MTNTETFQSAQLSRIKATLAGMPDVLSAPDPVVAGRLTRLSGMRLEVSGLRASIGSRCWIQMAGREVPLPKSSVLKAISWC